MFEIEGCKHDGCLLTAVTGTGYCFYHLENPAEVTEGISRRLKENETIKNLNAEYIELSDMSIAGKNLYVSRFSHGVFNRVDFSGCSLRIVFFDFCVFRDCLFKNTDMKYSVFAGATLNGCDFSSSDTVHCNFNRVTAKGCSFNGSDLYFSTFAYSDISDTTFVDCNLKKVRFNNTKRIEVSFKYSNYEEAFFGESPRL
ncbi:MAG: pentapeptide repeat-containing protein [Spirochaetales bacterium]|nr:pentapeptide repeat-containing protein [Spirochaetales bacterium]